MFSFFNKKKREYPPFNNLENSNLKDKYFHRTARWDWLDESMIHIIDNKQPRIITMDPWPQLIFLGADGQKTIKEFVYGMADSYGKDQPIPQELDKTILSLIEDIMKDEGVIAFSDSPIKLPYYLDGPIKSQYKDKAFKLMKEDGYIKDME